MTLLHAIMQHSILRQSLCCVDVLLLQVQNTFFPNRQPKKGKLEGLYWLINMVKAEIQSRFVLLSYYIIMLVNQAF